MDPNSVDAVMVHRTCIYSGDGGDHMSGALMAAMQRLSNELPPGLRDEYYTFQQLLACCSHFRTASALGKNTIVVLLISAGTIVAITSTCVPGAVSGGGASVIKVSFKRGRTCFAP